MLGQINGTPLNAYAVNTADVDAQFTKNLSAEKNADVQSSLETQNIFGIHLSKAGRDRAKSQGLNKNIIKYARRRNYDVKRIGMVIEFVKADPSLHTDIAQHMGTPRWREQFNLELKKNDKVQPLIDKILTRDPAPHKEASADTWWNYSRRRDDEVRTIHYILNAELMNTKDQDNPEMLTRRQELILSFISKLPYENKSAIEDSTRGQQLIYGNFGGGDGGSGGSGDGGGGGDGG